MRKVIIGTPSHDGKIDVWYVNSLVNTLKLALEKQIEVYPIYITYDSLVQRARNTIIKVAVEAEVDDLVMIDADMEWSPEWFFNFLDSPEDIIGAPTVKKSDTNEGYNVKLLNKELKYNNIGNLIEVDGVGTGFMKISKKALKDLWDMSPEYKNENQIQRMVFNIGINSDGDLVSEDFILCEKWKSLGNKIYIDPTITCNHIGVKKYVDDFNNFIKVNGYK